MRRQTEMTHAYQPNVLVDTTNLSRDEWLAYRRYGIGGSDAAAILGISPWRTARDLYYDKLGIAEVSENEDAEYVTVQTSRRFNIKQTKPEAA